MGKMGQSLEREGDPLALSRIDSVKLSETAGASFEDSLGGARKPGPEKFKAAERCSDQRSLRATLSPVHGVRDRDARRLEEGRQLDQGDQGRVQYASEQSAAFPDQPFSSFRHTYEREGRTCEYLRYTPLAL